MQKMYKDMKKVEEKKKRDGLEMLIFQGKRVSETTPVLKEETLLNDEANP